MSIHANQCWEVFQSPTLLPLYTAQTTNDTRGTAPRQAPCCRHLSLDYFFQALSQSLLTSSEQFLSPWQLIIHFPSLRHLSSPEHSRALYFFLMECRANDLDKNFIHMIPEFSLSPPLQRLLFLYHEYLLFKEANPHLLDPWDVIGRAVSKPLPFDRLIWIGFHQPLTLVKRFLTELSKSVLLTQVTLGPKMVKEHQLGLHRLSLILSRLRKQKTQTCWVLGPGSQTLHASLALPMEGNTVVLPQAYGVFDDIYGYLNHTQESSPSVPKHEFSEAFYLRAVEDYVLPESLTQDPLWQAEQKKLKVSDTRPHSPKERLTDYGCLTPSTSFALARLWTQHLALLELSQSASTPQVRMLLPRSHLFPSAKELLFLKTCALGCEISPQCFYPDVRPETLVWVTSPGMNA